MTNRRLFPKNVAERYDNMTAVIRSDARDMPLPDKCVDLIVTSPPYFTLRSYKDDGEHFDQIGGEDTPQEFVDALSACMVEWGRVLKIGGSVWVNLGDKYSGSGGHNNSNIGIDPTRGPKSYNKGSSGVRTKSLMGLPWRFAIAQIDAGWILRAEVIWNKPNGLPESVTDRTRRNHEQWFHFVKEPSYFSAIDELRVPTKDWGDRSQRNGPRFDETPGKAQTINSPPSTLGRLPSSVWTIPIEPLRVPPDVQTDLNLPDHFAAFPQEWPRRIIRGWSPSGICVECGEGRKPAIKKELGASENRPQAIRARALAKEHNLTNAHKEALLSVGLGDVGRSAAVQSGTGKNTDKIRQLADEAREVLGSYAREFTLVTSTLVGEQCACNEPSAPTTPSIILDPLGGTGTVAGVARMLGRYGISNDLSSDYNRLAVWRIWDSGQFEKSHEKWLAEKEVGQASTLETYLMSFPGIGKISARAIVDAVGNPFTLASDITEAKGVGEKAAEGMRNALNMVIPDE